MTAIAVLQSLGDKMKKVFSYLDEKKSLIFYILVVAVVFSSTCFLDVIITTRHGINFWNALFEGKILTFYSYNLDAHYLPGYNNSYSALYNICEYIIFALWDFPLWIYEKLSGNDSMGVPICLVYAKSIALAFGMACMYMLRQICISLSKSEIWPKVRLIVFTSVIVSSTVISMGQYDVISLFFILTGLNFYLQRNQKGFILFFAFAIPMKLFALLYFVPLLLIREKRISRVFLKMVCACSIFVFTTAVFHITDYEGVTASSSNFLIKKILVNNISISFEPVSLFLVFFILIAICCYLIKEKNDNPLFVIKLCLFISFFSLIIPSHPQWFIYSVPFFSILCCCMGEKNFGGLLFLETIFETAISFAHLIYLPGVCSANMVEITWIGKIFGRVGERGFLSFFEYLREMGLSEGVNGILKIALAMALASAVVFAIFMKIPHLLKCCERIEWKVWKRIRIMCCTLALMTPFLGYAVFLSE